MSDIEDYANDVFTTQDLDDDPDAPIPGAVPMSVYSLDWVPNEILEEASLVRKALDEIIGRGRVSFVPWRSVFVDKSTNKNVPGIHRTLAFVFGAGDINKAKSVFVEYPEDLKDNMPSFIAGRRACCATGTAHGSLVDRQLTLFARQPTHFLAHFPTPDPCTGKVLNHLQQNGEVIVTTQVTVSDDHFATDIDLVSMRISDGALCMYEIKCHQTVEYLTKATGKMRAPLDDIWNTPLYMETLQTFCSSVMFEENTGMTFTKVSLLHVLPDRVYEFDIPEMMASRKALIFEAIRKEYSELDEMRQAKKRKTAERKAARELNKKVTQ